MLGEERAQVRSSILESSRHNNRVKESDGSRYPFMIFRSFLDISDRLIYILVQRVRTRLAFTHEPARHRFQPRRTTFRAGRRYLS